MSKHQVLTNEDYFNHSVNKRVVEFIEQYCSRNELNNNEVKILDWGCGRGCDVIWLREKGYDAYGVDIDIEPISNGKSLLVNKEIGSHVLSTINNDGVANFYDRTFDIIISNQVFEHVYDLNVVAAEMARITKTGGGGYHVYPAHKKFVEGHLFMPIVHWFPKNMLRKSLIYFFVLCGVEPNWSELKERSISDRVDYYNRYSVNKTYYRNIMDIKNIFEKNNYEVSFVASEIPRVQKKYLLRMLSRFKAGRKFLDYLILTFFSCELVLTRK